MLNADPDALLADAFILHKSRFTSLCSRVIQIVTDYYRTTRKISVISLQAGVRKNGLSNNRHSLVALLQARDDARRRSQDDRT